MFLYFSLSFYFDNFSFPSFFVLFFSIFLFLLFHFRVKPLPGIYYSPPYLPIIGHAIHLQKNLARHSDNLLDHAQRAISLGHQSFQILIPFQAPFVHIMTPEAVEAVLKTNFESFEKGDHLRSRFTELLGDGIFNSDGKIHLKKLSTRRIPIFLVTNIVNFLPFDILHLTLVLDYVLENRWLSWKRKFYQRIF